MSQKFGLPHTSPVLFELSAVIRAALTIPASNPQQIEATDIGTGHLPSGDGVDVSGAQQSIFSEQRQC